MFIDGRSVPAGTIIDTDIAIIGAGAAGITLARALIGDTRRVVLVESGGLDFDADTQTLYEGPSEGVDYPLDAARLRYFGGSTNHWGGFCRPLAEIDFEKRDWVPYSGWPMTRAELDPYYTRAQQVAQLGRQLSVGDFDDTEAWAKRQLGSPVPFADDSFVTRFFIYSAPLRFGEAYRDEIGHAANITTYLNSNVLEIVPDATARRVERLRIATLSGNSFEVRPKLCVLAIGGIENARLLLLSNSVETAGLGNRNDLVGRFFMEHVHVPGQIALIAVDDKKAIPAYYDEPKQIEGAHVRAILMPSDAYLRREKRLGLNIAIYPMRAPGAEGTPEAEKPSEAGVAQLLQLQASGTATTIFGASCAAEPIPIPDNRVTLAPSRDALGQNRSKLTWRPAIEEHRDLARNVDALGQSFGRWGHGLVKALFAEKPNWSEEEIGWGNHHMGTTRMATDPRLGVVDADARVHGIDNLYVAGSSVFPTGGPVNPTLTIIALTGLIVWWPGKVPAGSQTSAITAHMDWLPTFASLAKASAPSDRKLDGIDISPVLLGKEGAKGHEVFHYYRGFDLQAVRSGPWKLQLDKNELFNLDDDIGESKNVAAQHADMVASLQKQADAMKLDLGDKTKDAPGVRGLGRVEHPQPLIGHDGKVRAGFDQIAKTLP